MNPQYVFFFALCLLAPLPAVRAETPPVKIIFDTDYDTDCDDPGALAVLHALADRGEARILATVASGRNPWSPAAIDVVNTYYGRPDIPLGAPSKGSGGKSRYAEGLATRFPHDTRFEDVPDAVAVYRRVLAAQPQGDVVIVTVGYTTNIAALLKSGPDQSSPLTGAELVRTTVANWVCLGGNFFGTETTNPNFTTDAAATIYAVDHWPTKLTFVGREIGSHPSPIRAGKVLATTPADNPVRVAYELYAGKVRSHHVADLTAVLHAVRGSRDYWDTETKGYMHFTGTRCAFEWRQDRDTEQAYLIPKGGWKTYTNKAEITHILDELLSQPPKLKPRE